MNLNLVRKEAQFQGEQLKKTPTTVEENIDTVMKDVEASKTIEGTTTETPQIIVDDNTITIDSTCMTVHETKDHFKD